MNLAYTAATMKIVFSVLALFAAAVSVQQRLPISADEVTLRHRIYGNERLAVFLLDIPPGQATLAHRHGRDMLSVFVSGGRTRACGMRFRAQIPHRRLFSSAIRPTSLLPGITTATARPIRPCFGRRTVRGTS